MGWTNRQAVVLFCTSCGVSDPSMLFCRPTGPHLAPFILPSPGRRSASCRPCAILRQTAIRQKTRPSTRAALPRQVRCSRYAESWVTARASRVARASEARRRSCAAVPVVCRSGAGTRQADGSRSGVAMSSVVNSGRESGHGNIDENAPEPRSPTVPIFGTATAYLQRPPGTLAS
jgi:hypothetical protein